jgi:hypothetical protein
VLLALLPYVATAILSLHAASDLPKVFDVAHATTRAFKVFFLVVAIVLPPLIMMDTSTDPNVAVYLTTTLVFALAMPPCWFLVYPKLWTALREHRAKRSKNGKRKSRIAIRRLLTIRREPSMHDNSISHHAVAAHHNPEGGKKENNKNSAKLALTIGKMYEDMGLHSQSLPLLNDALAVCQIDPMRDKKEQIGVSHRMKLTLSQCPIWNVSFNCALPRAGFVGPFNPMTRRGPNWQLKPG